MSDADTRATAAADDFIDVIASTELQTNAQRVLTIKGRRLLLCRTSAGAHAMLDVCPHARQPLAGGPVTGTTITCPHHGACFDLVSGQPRNGITAQALKLLPLREADGRIAVKLPPAPAGYPTWNKS